ncbi:MAG: sulfite exporter TauE/SafE family protein [Lentisphaeria bacterium]
MTTSTVIIVSCIILAIAVLMTMTGRGGGNFYVLILVLAGESMYQAATTGQFILMLTAVAGMLIFHKHKLIDWKLALVIDPPTDIMAFVGGYFASSVSGFYLKLILAALLLISGIFMMFKVKENPISTHKKWGYWHRKFGDKEYVVNLWLTLPITALVGLFAGAVGISGGSFKIPLMVLLCGVPMQIAVGTSSAMVAATALMGFLGHTTGGNVSVTTAIPIAIAAVIGGVIGGKFAIKTKPKNLKLIFAWTTIAASLIMIINALKTL